LSRRQLFDLSTVIDGLLVCLSFIVSKGCYTLIFDRSLSADGSYMFVGVLGGLLHFLLTRVQTHADPLRKNSKWGVVWTLAITFLTIIVIGYLLKEAEIHSRFWFALSFAFALIFITLKNKVVYLLIKNGFLREFMTERVAVFGAQSISTSLISTLNRECDNLCFIKDYRGASDHISPEASRSELRRLVADGLKHDFDRIIFCLPPNQTDELCRGIAAVSFLPARIDLCVGYHELHALKNSLPISLNQVLVTLVDRPHDDWGILLKRTIDVVLGSALLILAAPVMLLAALAIKLESKGPVFFRQRRHGWNHSIISVWKFRTMKVQKDEDGGIVKQAEENDVRVTRVGRILRKTSIDELPQLFNVLAGEMSLVGPRPHALAHNVFYSDLIAVYASRHRVKPGISGWAQVQNLRGNSEDISKMAARAEADLWYIRNWSLLLDLKILLMTPKAVLSQKNAF
jgi:putative colanic acid biosynthesis UDP-glucose lipid carrier transferase